MEFINNTLRNKFRDLKRDTSTVSLPFNTGRRVAASNKKGYSFLNSFDDGDITLSEYIERISPAPSELYFNGVIDSLVESSVLTVNDTVLGYYSPYLDGEAFSTLGTSDGEIINYWLIINPDTSNTVGESTEVFYEAGQIYLSVKDHAADTNSISMSPVATTFSGPQVTLNSTTTLATAFPVYADNAAAVVGGLAVNTIYKTATGELRIVHA